jgi:hypothetical protein
MVTLAAGRARAEPVPFSGTLRAGAPGRTFPLRVDVDGEGRTRVSVGAARGAVEALADVGRVDSVHIEQVTLVGGVEVAVVRLSRFADRRATGGGEGAGNGPAGHVDPSAPSSEGRRVGPEHEATGAGTTRSAVDEVGAVLVAAPGGRPEILATARTRWRGDPGERRAEVIDVADRTGDGAPDVVVATVVEGVSVCGSARTLLFPRAVEPRTQRLRPVVLSPWSGDGEEIGLVASADSPGPSGAPLLAGLRMVAASSAEGAGEDPVLVGAPRVLERAGEGAWAEGRGGPGRFEFVTARVETAGRPIRAFAITPAPRDPSLGERLGRPRTLWLVGDRGARLRVTMPEDGLRRPGGRYWVTPPAPLAWRCVSVVLDEVYAPAGVPPDAVRAGLSGVEAYTDLDFAGGLDHLVHDLAGDGPEAAAAGEVLARVPERAVPALASSWSRLSVTGRRRAVRVLGAALLSGEPTGPEGRAVPGGTRHTAIALLRDVATGDEDEDTRVQAVEALARALTGTRRAGPAYESGAAAGVPSPPLEDLDALDALVAVVRQGNSEPHAAADRAAERLASVGAGHFEPLLDALLLDGGADRPRLRAAVTEGLRRALSDPRSADAARVRLGDVAAGRDAERTAGQLALAALAAAPVATAAPEARALVAAAIARLPATGADAEPERDATFAARWRAVAALTVLGGTAADDEGAGEWLRDTALNSSYWPWMLRAAALDALTAQATLASPTLAVEGAAAPAAPESARARLLTVARAALADPYPRVRLAALRALARVSADAVRAAIALGRRDPFPLVRAGALAMLGDAGNADAREVTAALVAALGDPKETVRAAALEALTRRRERGAVAAVRARLADGDEWPIVTTAALGFVRATCAGEAAPEVLATLARGLRPQAWAPDVETALTALEVAVALGGASRAEALTLASRPSAPEALRLAAERLRALPASSCTPRVVSTAAVPRAEREGSDAPPATHP